MSHHSRWSLGLMAMVALPVSTGLLVHRTGSDASQTPAQLVSTYQTLADAILAVKHTEKNLVSSILATTYGHAEQVMVRIRGGLKAGKNVSQEVQDLAALVAQLGNEGDTAIAGVRKRLLEGGHHHNAAGEEQGIYDDGFVTVTRVAKKVFLDGARQIGACAAAPEITTLEAEWKKVATAFATLNP